MQRMFTNSLFDHCFSYLSPNPYSEACGGPNALSVYSSVPVVALPVPVPQTTNLPGNWTYAGCLQEPMNGRLFKYLNTWTLNNSAEACMNQCAAFGYPAAGVEVNPNPITKYVRSQSWFFYILFSIQFGIQCCRCQLSSFVILFDWSINILDCGDITDVAANGGVFGPEDQCGLPCPGDPIHLWSVR